MAALSTSPQGNNKVGAELISTLIFLGMLFLLPEKIIAEVNPLEKDLIKQNLYQKKWVFLIRKTVTFYNSMRPGWQPSINVFLKAIFANKTYESSNIVNFALGGVLHMYTRPVFRHFGGNNLTGRPVRYHQTARNRL